MIQLHLHLQNKILNYNHMIGTWQLILILMIVFVLFGAGKLPAVMGDIGKGLRNLRKGITETEDKKE